MRTFLAAAAFFLSSCFSASALTIPVPDIPASNPDLIKAAALAQEAVKNEAGCMLVEARWCLPADFQPSVSDGTGYQFTEDADSYSWFFTFVYKDERMQKFYERTGSDLKNAKYNAVRIVRVKKDGSIGGYIARRT